MDDLKPCPFCGGKAKIVKLESPKFFNFRTGEKNAYPTGACCVGCATSGCILHIDEMRQKAALFFIEEDENIAKAWNRRTDNG